MNSHSTASDPPRVRLFDLDLVAVDFAQAVTLLVTEATHSGNGAKVVATPNVDHLVRLDGMPAFRARYAHADYLFADGMPLVWASRMLGRPLPERVTGSDLTVALCKEAARHGWRIAMLGGMPGQEATLKALFAKTYPGLQVEIRCPSMQFDPVGAEGNAAAQWIREYAPQLIFVCLGMPKQETWALHHAPALRGGVVLCVGAAMDFALGLQRRAPLAVQKSGFEWLWRLGSNPRRLWRRYLVDDRKFLSLLWREWRRSRDASN
ncbi:WecB/TagA/CpsF family glycosyltransferase [Pigmentiphaga aceris]|uniref:WecB/TagA/CpsF family glycosyltransferase n=1 Tax=Pigmentiphaga aceris TaxID=1940612 RepID=UPI001FE56825|nr:WecB/TagA/CpsF family glycosyltransferase [Pigmentiphaga aceris]